jgi:hypothetical protein
MLTYPNFFGSLGVVVSIAKGVKAKTKFISIVKFLIFGF